ncbi:MAG TPA: hypothetical protein VGH87_00290, partial [Polyangiaceae bacterium]
TNASSNPCWPVAPMRLVALEHGTEWEPMAEMTGDGSIYVLKKEKKFFGRVSNDAMLDAHETPVLTCTHREVGLPGNAMKGKYDDHDAYVDGPTMIVVADDGMVTMNGHGEGHVKIEGPLPKAKRTAVLLVMAAMSQ